MSTNERAQVEEVFGLTGGELADEPWELPYMRIGFASDDGDTFGQVQLPTTYRCTYWYEGVPEYAADQYGYWQKDGGDFEYRTAVRDVMFGLPPEYTLDGWERVAVFHSSGEVECPGRTDPAGIWDGGIGCCPLCEGDQDKGNEHGYIYIGDGWAEVVYRRRITD